MNKIIYAIIPAPVDITKLYDPWIAIGTANAKNKLLLLLFLLKTVSPKNNPIITPHKACKGMALNALANAISNAAC